MKFTFQNLRKELYKQTYERHRRNSRKFKQSRRFTLNEVHTWRNPYLKLKFFYIIETASLISWLVIKNKININLLTIIGSVLAIMGFLSLSYPSIALNYLALFIFFSKNIIDYADGFVARLLKSSTTVGAFLDDWTGHLYYQCFFFSFPIYVFNQNNNINFLYISIGLFFLSVINPKIRIQQSSFTETLKNDSKRVIIKTLSDISKSKGNNQNVKSRFISFLSKLEYNGRTRYTDFILFVILIELQLGKILISDYICYLWLILFCLKILYILRKTLIIKK
jgi:hypothetical protein